MKIDKVIVRYGELRSCGYPSYSNKRLEVELSAQLEPGDIPAEVENKLLDFARTDVKRQFGDKDIEQGEMFKAL